MGDQGTLSISPAQGANPESRAVTTQPAQGSIPFVTLIGIKNCFLSVADPSPMFGIYLGCMFWVSLRMQRRMEG